MRGFRVGEADVNGGAVNRGWSVKGGDWREEDVKGGAMKGGTLKEANI